MLPTKRKPIQFGRIREATNPRYYPLYGNTRRNLVLLGGAGSGKSVFATQKIALRLMRESGHNIIAFRKVGSTLRDSICAEFRKTINTLGVASLWDESKSEFAFTYRPNGSRLRCMGLDDQEKLKSVAKMTSAWIEEATEFMPQDYEQINLRLRGKPATRRDGSPSYRQIIISFNPISALHWLKARFFDADQRGRTTTMKTTYKDNRFIDEQYKHELEELALRDPRFAAVYVRGEWGVLDGVIYQPWETPAVWPDHFDEVIYGLDFGFNNPSSLVEGGLYDGEAYLTEKIYQSGLTTGDLVDVMARLEISKTAPMYGDPAEPDRIEEIARAGYNIFPAEKGPGSVSAGIDLVQKTRIWTRSSNENINAENNTYCWHVDRSGTVTDTPDKANDHAMDAIRYMLWTHLSKHPEAGVMGGYDAMP